MTPDQSLQVHQSKLESGKVQLYTHQSYISYRTQSDKLSIRYLSDLVFIDCLQELLAV